MNDASVKETSFSIIGFDLLWTDARLRIFIVFLAIKGDMMKCKMKKQNW